MFIQTLHHRAQVTGNEGKAEDTKEHEDYREYALFAVSRTYITIADS